MVEDIPAAEDSPLVEDTEGGVVEGCGTVDMLESMVVGTAEGTAVQDGMEGKTAGSSECCWRVSLLLGACHCLSAACTRGSMVVWYLEDI